MRRPLLLSAAILALAAPPALAQSAQPDRAATGSGVVPVADNSAERPIRFAADVPPGGVLAIPMAGPQDISRVPAGLVEAVQAAVEGADFKAKPDQTLNLYGVGGHRRVLLVGVAEGDLDAVALANIGGRVAQATRTDAAPVAIIAQGFATSLAHPGAHVAQGVGFGQWRFDRLKTVDRTAPPLDPITVVAPEGTAQA
ncbi:MAG: hypothetical protein B7X57_08295, partial [Erythrobacter sp. 34-65-8]